MYVDSHFHKSEEQETLKGIHFDGIVQNLSYSCFAFSFFIAILVSLTEPTLSMHPWQEWDVALAKREGIEYSDSWSYRDEFGVIQRTGVNLWLYYAALLVCRPASCFPSLHAILTKGENYMILLHHYNMLTTWVQKEHFFLLVKGTSFVSL